MSKACLFAKSFVRAAWYFLFDMFSLVGQTAFCPAIENMTVATRKASTRPIHKFCISWFHSFRGPSGALSHQSQQNVVHVNSLKRMRYRHSAGGRVPVNPNEKPPKANGFVVTTFAQQGFSCTSLYSLGNVVLTLCGGSGFIMEACMHTGRSCIMLEIDGNLLFGHSLFFLSKAV